MFGTGLSSRRWRGIPADGGSVLEVAKYTASRCVYGYC